MINKILISEKFFLVISVLAAAMVIAALLLAVPVKSVVEAADTQTGETKRTLNVVGQGKVTVSPDVAYITLGVVTEAKNAGTAQTINRDSMSKVISSVRSAGVNEKDIKTTNYSINPKYNYVKDTGERQIIGYSVNNSVKVTIRNIAKVGEILDLAAKNGANVSNGIKFGLSDNEKYYKEALKNAVEVAKGRAGTMAGVLGIELGVPVNVSESGTHYPVYYDSYAKAEMNEAVSTPIQEGTLEVTANVSLTYEY